MAIIAIDHDRLAARLTSDAKGSPKAVQKAIYSAAQRARSFLVGVSPVDRGILKVAWKVIRSSHGAEVANDQPYAGVMERGARPFRISSEGLFALKGWVMRKLQSGEMNGRTNIKTKKLVKRRKTPELEQEAENIAYAIAAKFKRVGMKGKFFVMKNLPKLVVFMSEEINRSLSNFFDRKARE